MSIRVLMQLAPTTKPWQENWVIDAVALGSALFMIAAVWLWARSGRSKADNEVPFDHTAESFAGGSIFAGYGPIPLFLVVIYIIVLIAMIGYSISALSSGVQY